MSQPAGPRGRIVLLEDERALRRLLTLILEGEGYQVYATDDGKEALQYVYQHDCDLIIQDLKMPKMDGLDFLRQLREWNPEVAVIVMTAYGTWETAVEAMRLGAHDHLDKPFDTDDLRALAARTIESRRLHREMSAKGTTQVFHLADIIGSTAAMRITFDLVSQVAPTNSTILIQGESGTGKELIARAIHYGSPRAHQPFVAANCGAFTETLLESELFGHLRGAFTGAVADRKGLFEIANRGTLFLDEIAEMSPQTQVKVLRVLETREFQPVGSHLAKKVDVRFIAATNRNLAEAVEGGAFREDLYHRLNVIPLLLPPLRERRKDIPLLAGHFLARFARQMKKHVTGFTERSMALLEAYDWPGNVRELENAIERAIALCKSDKITERDLWGPVGRGAFENKSASPAGSPSSVPGRLLVPPEGLDLGKKLEETERDAIEQALRHTDWNLTEAAKLLGMTFRSIRYRVNKLGIKRPP